MDALQQGLCVNEYFDDKYIEFNAKWLQKRNQVNDTGYKIGKKTNPYDSLYKLIR